MDKIITMLFKGTFGERAGGLVLRLLVFVWLLGSSSLVHAGSAFCSDYLPTNAAGFHVIDGNDPGLNTVTLPSSIGIDANCYFKNFQISAKWPQGLTSTLNFKADAPSEFLAIFENVYYSGNMACSQTTTNIWFVNNAQYDPNNSCQSLFIPVETVGKQTPGPSASVGVPFTYTLTVAVMFDPATGTYYPQPSPNTLSNATIYDDLTTTGASLTYVSNTAFLVNGATRTPIGPLTLGATPPTLSALGIPASDSTKHIVFSSDSNAALTNVTAYTQVEIQMTVVLDNVPANAAGTQFTNTAKWWFGRVIDGVAYTPLPGQSGVSLPMTIVEPSLTLRKTSTFTNLNVGTAAPFRLDVQNTGGSDAWNTTITDILPAVANEAGVGGMCAYNPTPSVTARVFASDGVTPVSPVLVSGTDYTVNYSGCTLSLTMLSANAKIAPLQRLIVTYEARLDGGTAPGLTFSNVAGATQWYSGASSETGRRQYDRTLGTAAQAILALDYQDAYTLTSTTQGYFFLKSVADQTTGVPVATTAYPGDWLRYTLQIQNFTFPVLNNITVTDDLDAAFVPGTLTNVNVTPPLPGGATLTFNPNGGANGTGSLSINGLNLASNTQYQIQFDAQLASTLANGTIVSNQGSLSGTDSGNVVWSGISDDPYLNGPSLLSASGDITRVQIFSPGALSKANTQATATIGQQFNYRITVPATPVNVPLYDVRILDNLGLSAANLGFVNATVVSGGAWSVTNAGTASNLILQDASTGIDIPAGGQAVIDITVVLQNTATNQEGLTFSNSASYTYNKTNGDNATQGIGAGATTANMTVLEPNLGIVKEVSYTSPGGKLVTDPAAVGDVLQYTVTLSNNGTSTAYDVDVIDAMPANLSLVIGSATAAINGVAVSGFVLEPTVLPDSSLVWGAQNGDGNLDIPVGGTLVLRYLATVLSANGTPIINSAYTDWASLNGGVVGERNGAGCPIWTDPNNYCAGPAITSVTSLDPTALVKAVVSDSWTTAPSTFDDETLRVGDTVVYTLTATLREGTTQNVVLSDTLPAGMVFDGVVSINGDATAPYSAAAPFTYSDFSGPVLSGNTITWSLGNITNAVDNIAANNGFVIQYRARVLNTLAQLPVSQLLTNNATLNYAIGGVPGTQKTASAPINVWQPQLNVSKSAAPAGGDTVLVAGELVNYTVSITNSGSAPAYNPVLQDILPTGMCSFDPKTTVSAQVFESDGVTAVSGVLAVGADYTVAYNGCTLTVTMLSTTTAIAPTQRLIVKYTAHADATLGAGMALNNQAQVLNYYSLDSSDASVLFRKDYGSTNTAVVQLTTASATSLSKLELVSTVSIGQPFTYRITLPAVAQATALNDVRVLDDISLAKTGVSLSYLSASAYLEVANDTWTLANSGTATNLILQDSTTGGLDIPANDRLFVDVVLILNNDTVNNMTDNTFSNAATYTYNSINNDINSQANGAPGASGLSTIVAPDLVVTKNGPATMRVGVPGDFTLKVQNNGAATAWNVVVSDVLPNVTTAPIGGMCGTAPTGITAQVFNALGTAISGVLVAGTDFPAPSFTACTLTINLPNSVSIAPNNYVIISYNASLDAGSAAGMNLDNFAGASQWLTADPSVPGTAAYIHTVTNTLTSDYATAKAAADFQDAWRVTTEAPVVTFTKEVFNKTTNQSGVTARPGDTLSYTLTITNISTLAATNFALTDDLDSLNTPAMFVPGSLVLDLATIPAGANISLTSTIGGVKGTGLVSISGLNIAAQGFANDTVVIEYDVTLVPVINNGAQVRNQASIGGTTLPTQLSDDPLLGGVTDPTLTTITSAPSLRVHKTVQDLTGDPLVVQPGDTLRYTITINNIGTENAKSVSLRDLLPENTTYVAQSTRLNNGAPLADIVINNIRLSPLHDGNGIPINPLNGVAGEIPADATLSAANTVTVTFDVRVAGSALSGTIISNQAFVNGMGEGGLAFLEKPSDWPEVPDDPSTVNIPTLSIVGNLPLLRARKAVAIVNDRYVAGILDPGLPVAEEELQYTITIENLSPVAATGVVFTDPIPGNTTYVAGTTRLNGALVADIGAGLTVGTIAGNSSVVITFEVLVNAGLNAGDIISNQGNVTSAQLPTVLTDGDLNSVGYQTTDIRVGTAQQVVMSKAVSVQGGGTALPNGYLDYVVRVTNSGTVAISGLVLRDDLSLLAGPVTYISGTASTLNGLSVSVNYAASWITTAPVDLQPGETLQLRFKVLIDGSATLGTTITNMAAATWTGIVGVDPTASISIDVGGVPGSATLNGRVWHDANYNKLADDGSGSNLDGWSVEVWRSSTRLGSVITAGGGLYSIPGLTPSVSAADQYKLIFLAPGATATTAKLGFPSSPPPFINTVMQEISGIAVSSGANLQNLNLPIEPNGVIYNSMLRTPVAGAMLELYPVNSTVPVLANCFNDLAQQGQVTLASGYYKFDWNTTNCTPSGAYRIQVTPPASYMPGQSLVIPAQTSAFDVRSCPVDAIAGTNPDYCEVQAYIGAPAVGVNAPATDYYLNMLLDYSAAIKSVSSQIFNNYIPLDPRLDNAVTITKVASLQNVTRGQIIPYTITVSNTLRVTLTNINIVDTFPAGFKYVAGSGRLDGVPVEPVSTTRNLTWGNLALAANTNNTNTSNTKRVIQLMLIVGSGVNEGKYINRAQVFNSITGGAASPEASATVRVIPDPTLDCSDVIGKVFDDENLNGYQDEGEQGLPGVRVVTARGLIVTADKFGRFHVTCAVVPDPDRGSNFILKVDDRTLPSGYRMTTENPRVERATRGKMLKFNFGAAIHKVVKLDMSDGVFEPGTTEMRVQWKQRIKLLLGELKKAASVLRLSYLAETEDESLVNARLKLVKDEIAQLWKMQKDNYDLTIETEVFWRTGSPPGKSVIKE